MIRMLKQLFCKHFYRLIKWHLTHGPSGNDPVYVEAYFKCDLCGKKKYIYPKRNSKLEQAITKIKELQE